MPSKEELEKAVLVITADDACGYKIERVVGLVYGVGTGAGRVAANKAKDAYAEALAYLRLEAYNRGANGVVAIRPAGFGSSAGGALGDAAVITLAGTAVILGPRPSADPSS